MEPSSAEDGDCCRPRCPDTPTPASMEPSSAEDGDLLRSADVEAGSTASMEPSSAEDGDKPGQSVELFRGSGFNGAVLS